MREVCVALLAGTSAAPAAADQPVSAPAETIRERRAIQFFVPGIPTPAGSKRAFVVKGKPVLTDSSGAKGKHWRAAVQLAAATACTVPLEGPLGLFLVFKMTRPAGHSGQHGLKRSAPMYPVVRPDTTKLVRAVEDAMTGIVWKDDAQVVWQTAVKEYTMATPGVDVRVEPVGVPDDDAER